MMNKITNIILMLIILAVLPLTAGAIKGTADYIYGDVKIQSSGSNAYKALHKGDPVYEGDVIMTGTNSVADIKFDAKTFSRIAENSELEISKSEIVEYTSKKLFFKKRIKLKNIQLNVKKGKLLSKVGTLHSASKFRVKTPACVVGVRGTVFETSHNTNSTVKVLSGVVTVVNPALPNMPISVSAGQIATVAMNQAPAPPRSMSNSEASDVMGLLDGTNAGGATAGPSGEAAPAEIEIESPPAYNINSLSSSSENVSNTVLSPNTSNPIINIIQETLPPSKIKVNITVK